jgi:putative transcriptional regulator
MKITHHPDDSTLMSYVAGSLSEGLAAVVAAHVSLCSACAREVRTLELVGAALFERLETVPMARAAPVMALRAAEADVLPAVLSEVDPAADVPVPLQGLAGQRIDDIRWRRLGMGVWHVPLPLSKNGDGDLRLLRVAPGQSMPNHGHGGIELTLILRGTYSDRFGVYRPGDVADLDQDVEHQPFADPELGCICIIASEQRARFKGLFGRIMQPLTGL